jgi:hypothetical protein
MFRFGIYSLMIATHQQNNILPLQIAINKNHVEIAQFLTMWMQRRPKSYFDLQPTTDTPSARDPDRELEPMLPQKQSQRQQVPDPEPDPELESTTVDNVSVDDESHTQTDHDVSMTVLDPSTSEVNGVGNELELACETRVAAKLQVEDCLAAVLSNQCDNEPTTYQDVELDCQPSVDGKHLVTSHHQETDVLKGTQDSVVLDDVHFCNNINDTTINSPTAVRPNWLLTPMGLVTAVIVAFVVGLLTGRSFPLTVINQ